MKKELNLDLLGSAYKFESLVKKIFPKIIRYKLFRSKGLEFDGYRVAEPYEDADNIDWKASLRSNLILAKKYVEEKETKAVIIVDVGENMVFGSQEKLKCEYSAELAASLFNVMIKTGEEVGYMLFNEDIVKLNFPKKGKEQFENFLNDISDAENYGGISDLSKGLDRFLDTFDSSIDIVILISDFNSINYSNKGKLERLGGMYDVISIVVRDPLDVTFPDINKEVVIEDPVTSERLVINPSLAKGVYEYNSSVKVRGLRKVFSNSNIDFIELFNSKDFVLPLAKFFKKRSLGRGF